MIAPKRILMALTLAALAVTGSASPPHPERRSSLLTRRGTEDSSP
jgi:hypothetical protein